MQRIGWRRISRATASAPVTASPCGCRTGVETAIALLACSRNGYMSCPSLHRNHRVREVVALAERMRCSALIAQPAYGAAAGQPSQWSSGKSQFWSHSFRPQLRYARQPAVLTQQNPPHGPSGDGPDHARAELRQQVGQHLCRDNQHECDHRAENDSRHSVPTPNIEGFP
jgi:hypothetical protein